MLRSFIYIFIFESMTYFFIHVPFFLNLFFKLDSNEYLLAKIGFDTDENEPLKV